MIRRIINSATIFSPKHNAQCVWEARQISPKGCRIHAAYSTIMFAWSFSIKNKNSATKKQNNQVHMELEENMMRIGVKAMYPFYVQCASRVYQHKYIRVICIRFGLGLLSPCQMQITWALAGMMAQSVSPVQHTAVSQRRWCYFLTWWFIGVKLRQISYTLLAPRHDLFGLNTFSIFGFMITYTSQNFCTKPSEVVVVIQVDGRLLYWIEQ